MNNKVHPLTVVSPVRRFKWLLLYLVLSFLTQSSFASLRRLRMVHFARWTLIRRHRFPRPLGMPWRRRPDRPMLLFSSNFNGPMDSYLDAFARTPTIKLGVRVLWWATPRFPNPSRLSLFKQIVGYYELHADYYYCAYPQAGMPDIAAAIALDAKLQAFELKCRSYSTNAEFSSGMARLLNEAALDLRCDLHEVEVNRRVIGP